MTTSEPANPTEQVEMLRQALRQSRCNMVIVCLLLATLIGGAVCVRVFSGSVVEAKEDELVTAVKDQLAAQSGRLTQEAGELVTETFPPMARAFGERMQEDLPVYVRALDKEGTTLREDLEAALRKKVDRRYRDYLAQHRDILQAEFPEITDKLTMDRMVSALERAVNRLAQHYYVEEFRGQVSRLVRRWDEVPPLPPGRAGDTKLEKRLADHLSEWLLLQISEGGSPLSLGRKPSASGETAIARTGKGE